MAVLRPCSRKGSMNTNRDRVAWASTSSWCPLDGGGQEPTSRTRGPASRACEMATRAVHGTAIDEMPGRDDHAVRVWAPPAALIGARDAGALRRHRRDARRRCRPGRRRRRDDALTEAGPLQHAGKDEVLVRASLANQVRQCPRGSPREVRTPNRHGDRALPQPPVDLHAAARAPGRDHERTPRDREARRLRGGRPRAHHHYQNEAACGQLSVQGRVRLTGTGPAGGLWPPSRVFRGYCATVPRSAAAPRRVVRHHPRGLDTPRLVSSDASPTRPEWAVTASTPADRDAA